MTPPAGSEGAGLVLSAEEREAFAARVADVVALGAELEPDDLRDTETAAVAFLASDWFAARVEAARAEAVHQAADEIQALHPGEVKNSVVWLHEDAARIARTPSPARDDERGGA